MKKIHVELVVKLDIEAKDDVKVNDIINEMDYNFTSQTEGAQIVETEIMDYEVKGYLFYKTK